MSEKKLEDYIESNEPNIYAIQEDLNINILKFENRHKQIMDLFKKTTENEQISKSIELINLYGSLIKKFDLFLKK